jgi:hypothetical protein
MTPIERFIEQTFTRSTLRHFDILISGHQLTQWKAEEDQQTNREARAAEKAAGHKSR